MTSNGVIKILSESDRSYYLASDVMSLLGVSRNKAYEMIRALRQELIDSGQLASFYPQGKVPKTYFKERMGMGEHYEKAKEIKNDFRGRNNSKRTGHYVSCLRA